MVLIGLRNGSLIKHDHIEFTLYHFTKRDIFASDVEIVGYWIFRDLRRAALYEFYAHVTGTVVELLITL